MRLQGREISPTRATQLALRDEQTLIHEGYEFLDEKRMLLAQELLRQLERIAVLNERGKRLQQTAKAALVQAAMRHGLEELSVYPPPLSRGFHVTTTVRTFLGLSLADSTLSDISQPPEETSPLPTFPSLEAQACADAFDELLAFNVERAAVTANLLRLSKEYVQTERRARALENVLLPEIAEAVKEVGEHLEAEEQEEAMQLRHVTSRPTNE